jgi:hypothetical protein
MCVLSKKEPRLRTKYKDSVCALCFGMWTGSPGLDSRQGHEILSFFFDARRLSAWPHVL